MDKIALFEEIEKLLCQKAKAANITDLNRYYCPAKKEKSVSDYYCLASSIQNGTSSGMDKSIKFNGENNEIIRQVLFDCDYNRVLEEYKDPCALYNEFSNHITDFGAVSRKERANKGNKTEKEKEKIYLRKTNWQKYSIGLYEGALFLKEDETKGTLKKLLSFNDSEKAEFNIENIKTLIRNIKIPGLGDALCCDWLKECGCTWLVKPDVHIKMVYAAMMEKETGNTVSKIDNFDVIEYFYNWAQELQRNGKNVTAYQLDKMIWLICTGEFYLHKDETIGRGSIIKKISE